MYNYKIGIIIYLALKCVRRKKKIGIRVANKLLIILKCNIDTAEIILGK